MEQEHPALFFNDTTTLNAYTLFELECQLGQSRHICLMPVRTHARTHTRTPLQALVTIKPVSWTAVDETLPVAANGEGCGQLVGADQIPDDHNQPAHGRSTPF